MRIARWLTLLLCLVALSEFFPRRARADNPCQQSCAQNYQVCIADAQGQYDQCEFNAASTQFGCDGQAEAEYDNCLWDCATLYPWWTSCETQLCEPNLIDDYNNCWNNYLTAEQNCYNSQQSANQVCENVYDSCYENCPP